MNRWIWLALIASRHNRGPVPRWQAKLILGMLALAHIMILGPIVFVLLSVAFGF